MHEKIYDEFVHKSVETAKNRWRRVSTQGVLWVASVVGGEGAAPLESFVHYLRLVLLSGLKTCGPGVHKHVETAKNRWACVGVGRQEGAGSRRGGGGEGEPVLLQAGQTCIHAPSLFEASVHWPCSCSMLGIQVLYLPPPNMHDRI